MKTKNRKRWRYQWKSYLLIALPVILILVFNYFPIFNGFIHVFYRWDGDRIEEFVGLGNIRKMAHDAELWRSFGVLFIFVTANLFKMVPPIIAAVILHHVLNARWQYVYRVCFVIPMIVPVMVSILMWKYFYEPSTGAFNQVLREVGILNLNESVLWLADRSKVLGSLIFVGFPWVGAFGILIYLAGLQNISSELYEAAEIDGAGAGDVFWNIELPLIVTQIRINLLLMVIHTVQGWEFVYLFLQESGGPGGIATVPGLLIFRDAFSRGFFGYGCAVGFLLFFITLVVTIINNKYVRVDK